MKSEWQDVESQRTAASECGRLMNEAASAYWLRFLNSRWLVYWHERLIADFPAEDAKIALAFLRLKREQRTQEGSACEPADVILVGQGWCVSGSAAAEASTKSDRAGF